VGNVRGGAAARGGVGSARDCSAAGLQQPPSTGDIEIEEGDRRRAHEGDVGYSVQDKDKMEQFCDLPPFLSKNFWKLPYYDSLYWFLTFCSLEVIFSHKILVPRPIPPPTQQVVPSTQRLSAPR
jgi:hypothetical protein